MLIRYNGRCIVGPSLEGYNCWNKEMANYTWKINGVLRHCIRLFNYVSVMTK